MVVSVLGNRVVRVDDPQTLVVDALSNLGERHLDLPCTPEQVGQVSQVGREWPTVRAARPATAAPPRREPPDVFDALPARAEARPPEEIER